MMTFWGIDIETAWKFRRVPSPVNAAQRPVQGCDCQTGRFWRRIDFQPPGGLPVWVVRGA